MLSLLLCISLVLGRAVQLGAAPPPPPPPPTPPPPPPPDPQRCTCRTLPPNCISGNATTCNSEPCVPDCNGALTFDPPFAKSAAVHETLMTFGPPTLAMTLAAAAYTTMDNAIDATADIQSRIWSYFTTFAGSWCGSYTTPSTTYGSVIWVGIVTDSFGVENLMYLYWLQGTNPGAQPLPPIPTLPLGQSTVTLVLAIRGSSSAGIDETFRSQPAFVFPSIRNASVTCGYKTAAGVLLTASDPRYPCSTAPCTVEKLLRYLVEDRANTGVTLQIAGHGLGGGVAPLVAVYLHSRIADVVTITNVWGFAAPAIGNFDYRQALEDYIPNVISLYRNPLDIVPYLFADFTPITSLYQRWNSCPCQRDCDVFSCLRYCTQYQPWSQPLYYHPSTNQLNNLPADINVGTGQVVPDSTQAWEYNVAKMHSFDRYVRWMYTRSCTRP